VECHEETSLFTLPSGCVTTSGVPYCLRQRQRHCLLCPAANSRELDFAAVRSQTSVRTCHRGTRAVTPGSGWGTRPDLQGVLACRAVARSARMGAWTPSSEWLTLTDGG